MRISDQAYNRHQILKAIRRRSPISRTELAALTGLSGATITEVTADLAQRGLLIEERAASAGRGRPRTQLSIDPDGGRVIGVTLLPTHMVSSSFVDLAGNLLSSSEAPIGSPSDLHGFASRIAEILEVAISASPFDRTEISRVAIALPGLVDTVTGFVHWMTTFEEAPFPFASLIADRLHVPVTIENDSTCLARAEHWFGQAQSLDDFSVFHIDTWVDAAQYSGGVPRSGGNGFNSEIGHVKTDHSQQAHTCLCGAKGCLALYGSIYGIVLNSGKLDSFDIRSPFDLLPLYREILDKAENGDPAATQLFIAAGEHLGIAIADHINAFDPANVLVLMSDPGFMNLVVPSLEQAVARNVFRPLGDRTNVQVGTAIDGWRWKGAAAHALEQTYLVAPTGAVTLSKQRDRLAASPYRAPPRHAPPPQTG